jgi:hypothetical protein
MRPHLERDELVEHVLVDEVRDELERGDTERLVAPPVRDLELLDHSAAEQQANHRELRVDDCHERCEDWCERNRRGLRLHDALAEEPLAAVQVLAEELRQDLLDVVAIDLVHHAVERLAQRLPHHALVLLARLVLRRLRHHLLEPERRDVDAAAARQSALCFLLPRWHHSLVCCVCRSGR